jgi:hypothetical protein
MALADIVLEGLTLILVIALGAVLIGGLSYLTTTTASANNARLMTAGTYVYLAGPTYINGTLYVPMYNIGEYTVDVKYLFVEGLNGVQEYATNIILKPGQYYVYELSIDYTPKAVTIVVSPTRDPKLVLEFDSNVSTPGPIALTPMSQGSSGGGLIAVSVVDPYNAGWTVSWSYSGQSYSLSRSTSYAWFINPPYVPIQITFSASITQNPTGYACQVVPSSVTNTYNAGSVQAFNVTCSISPITVSVSDSYNAGWSITWSGAASGSQSGSSSTTFTVQPSSNNAVTFTASITSTPSGYTSCSISPQSTTANPGQTVTFTVSCSGGSSPPPGGGNEYAYVYTDISAPSGVSWTVYLYFDGQLDATYQGSGSQSYGPAVFSSSGTVNYEVSGIPNTCSVSYSPSQSFSITPGNTYTETITITCQGQQPPPPPMCYFTYSASTNPSGLQMPSSFGLSGPSSLNPGSSGDFGGSAPLTAVDSQGDKYQFQYWSVSSNPSGYAWSGETNQADFSAPLSCPSNLNSTVTVQITGTAVYQFVECESYSVGINLDTSGEATLSWSWCPLDPAVSWSASGSAGVNATTGQPYIQASGQVTSQSGVTKGATSQQVSECSVGQTIKYNGVNPSGGSINPPQASGSVTFQVEFTCQSNGGKGPT